MQPLVTEIELLLTVCLKHSKTHQESIRDVRKTLRGCRKSGRETMAAVDNLKRLCIDHYFEEEVESAMAVAVDLIHSDDLLDATLSFRLLRETGHDVSAGQW